MLKIFAMETGKNFLLYSLSHLSLNSQTFLLFSGSEMLYSRGYRITQHKFYEMLQIF